MSDPFERLFGNFRPGPFGSDPHGIPQEIAAGNGNIMPTGWLEDDSVTSDVIRANSVIAGKVAANAITANEIAANTITANEIAANAITASELAADSVTTNKILAANVTSAKIELTISGKNFGANDGSESAPGVYFDSANTVGMIRSSGILLIKTGNSTGPRIGLDPGGSTGFYSGGSEFYGGGTSGSIDLGKSANRWGTVWCVTVDQSSDARLKTDIADSPLGLGFIRQLRPRVFRWLSTPDTQARQEATRNFDRKALQKEEKPWEDRIRKARAKILKGGDVAVLEAEIAQARERLAEIRDRHSAATRAAVDASRPGKRLHLGLIAQEVKETLDGAGVDVALWKEDEDGYQSLSYTELIVPALKAIQELADRNEALEARLADLEGHSPQREDQ